MAEIAPFRGLLYNAKKIGELSRVVAPPYNVVRLFLNQEPEPYEHVAQLFDEWQREGILVRDEKPSIYFLRQRFSLKDKQEKERWGFLAVARLEDFSSGAIRPHEGTLAAPKEDRLRIMLSTHANLSPIFTLYDDPKQTINRLLAEHTQGSAPHMEAKEERNGTCRLWRIDDPGLIAMARRDMAGAPLFIADGHHRYEAALNYRDRMRAENPGATGRA